MAIGMAHRRAGPNGETDPFGRASPPRKVYQSMATLEQNKAVVRRFMTEVLQGGNLDVVDEVLDPSYVNTSMGNVDRTAFKAMLGALKSAGMTFDIKELVAEGDAVVARFTVGVTQSGQKTTALGLTYYRVVNGKITIDEPLSSPDLGQLLAPFLGQLAHA
jgi:predicted ester cyclase